MTRQESPAQPALHLRRLGKGRPALALHCSLAQGGVWAALASGLPGWQLLAPDMPGHGRSPDWDGKADYHAVTTAAVAGLLADIAGPAPLIGHSFGATVALRLALEHPGAVSRLVLFEPVLFCAADALAFERHMAAHEAFGAALQAGDARRAAAEFQAIWGTGQAYAELPMPQQVYIADRIGLIGAQNPALIDDIAGLLAPGRLEGLDIPVLLLRGDASPPVIAAIHAELARRLPRAAQSVVRGAGHMLPITHAAECAARVRDFLER